VDHAFALAWALCSAPWAALLTLAAVALDIQRSLDGSLETCEQLEANLASEQRQFKAYRKHFGPVRDWADDRALTVVYREGQGVSYATGRDLAIRGLTPATSEDSGYQVKRASVPPPPPTRQRRG
jgi:hypothetical protein